MLFLLYVFLVIMLLPFDRLPVKWSLSHTVVDIRFPPLQICSYRSPWMALRWLYMVMLFLLQLTQLSSQLSFVNKNIYNQKFPNQLYFQRKSHNVCCIQSCYIADTCTERATHFRLSSGRHMHAWRAYFSCNL